MRKYKLAFLLTNYVFECFMLFLSFFRLAWNKLDTGFVCGCDFQILWGDSDHKPTTNCRCVLLPIAMGWARPWVDSTWQVPRAWVSVFAAM